MARLAPLGPDAASRKAAADRHLDALVDLFLRGMREPLPLYLRTSAAWAEAVSTGRNPDAAASSAWTSAYRFDKEDKEAEHALVLGDDVAFDEVVGRCGPPGPTKRMGALGGDPFRRVRAPPVGRTAGARTGRGAMTA